MMLNKYAKEQKLKIGAGACLLACFVFSVFSSEIQPNYPVLIFDVMGNPTLPANFRTSTTPFIASQKALPTRLGLDALNISGSGQFTGENLKNIIPLFKFKKVYVIDLRQESHGFLDNTPISWYGYRDAENKNRTTKEINLREKELLSNLALIKKTLVYTRIKQGGDVTFKPSSFTFERAYTEEALVKNNHLKYKRFTVQDYHAPTVVEVDKFLDFVKHLPPKTWLHFHCHAGRGRTTTFMVLYDILKNAPKVSLQDILQRQALIGGKDLQDTNTPKTWKIAESQGRLAFIQAFYAYRIDPNGYGKQTFSVWMKKS